VVVRRHDPAPRVAEVRGSRRSEHQLPRGHLTRWEGPGDRRGAGGDGAAARSSRRPPRPGQPRRRAAGRASPRAPCAAGTATATATAAARRRTGCHPGRGVTERDVPEPAEAGEDGAEVIGLPALVQLDPPTAVEVLVDGEWWPGFASAYRGRRFYVSWTKEPGMRHLTWKPADQVRRTTARTLVRESVLCWVDGRRHVARPRHQRWPSAARWHRRCHRGPRARRAAGPAAAGPDPALLGHRAAGVPGSLGRAAG
jgi:hypothetical protein